MNCPSTPPGSRICDDKLPSGGAIAPKVDRGGRTSLAHDGRDGLGSAEPRHGGLASGVSPPTSSFTSGSTSPTPPIHTENLPSIHDTRVGHPIRRGWGSGKDRGNAGEWPGGDDGLPGRHERWSEPRGGRAEEHQ